MENTITGLEIRFERKEIPLIEDLSQEVVDRIEDDQDYEYRSDWEHFFDLNFKDVLASAIKLGLFINETWDHVTIEPSRDDDFEYDGYILMFCATTIASGRNDIVVADVHVNNNAKVTSVKIGGEVE